MQKKVITIIIGIVVVLVVAGIVWWRWTSMSTPKYTGPVETIRLAVSRSGPDLSALIWIAEEQGYFKNEGLDVQISQEDSGVIAQRKVASGDLDIATDSDFGFVGDIFTINNLRILASIDQAKVIDVVARRDSEINVPTDLKGKRIGVPYGLAQEFFFNGFLISNNILSSQVNAINTPVIDLQKAIMSREVDAIAVSDPAAYNTKVALAKNGVSWSAQPSQPFSWLIISSDQFLKNHPEAAMRFIKSLLSAENFLKANSEKGKQMIKDKLAEDQEYFDQNWPKHRFVVALDQSLLITMESEARWIIANKSTNQTVVPNYLNYIYFDALTKIKPEAVTIIH